MYTIVKRKIPCNKLDSHLLQGSFFFQKITYIFIVNNDFHYVFLFANFLGSFTVKYKHLI